MNTISFSHTLDAVLSGKKTQTRRIWKDAYVSVIGKDGDICALVPQRSRTYFNEDSSVEMWTDQNMFVIHYNGALVNGKAFYAVDGVNTVTGGRGKPSVKVGDKKLQIRVTKIRIEDVRWITPEDVKAEGFSDYISFMRVWCAMHDKPMLKKMEALWHDVITPMFFATPHHNKYKVVVLDFEVVKNG